ncbi:hypothetical protein CFIMG_002818RA [Ceratocystis fimbriata CBS 114723]|uniref:Mitochondrial ribosomal protein L51 / S25 / CI-B8 domain protein n=2 Tax=Ceratocystis TaxID=5157 RepID=A0A0F8B5C3_CERFI|nr:Mitochondrial ribosomal protein L51 / S25 / CI-B8 domain protein [Ceratocystis platani]PHH53923.1 hypothetical protein CFIMG_002818RA [Ceratocystis fimbriata CBS 114723]
MVGTATRWHNLRNLLKIRFGPGAAVLPPNVTRIHMDFARNIRGGHMGPRKFWQEILPRLKYHNPLVPMIVCRRLANEGPATMTIYLRKSTSETAPESDGSDLAKDSAPSAALVSSGVTPNGVPAPAPQPDETTITIDMKNLHTETILTKFLDATKAIAVEPTPEESKEIAEDRLMSGKAEIDRVRVKTLVDEQRRERDMLERARKDLAGI